VEEWDNGRTERKNINRGLKKLHVWQGSVSLYILACEIFTKFPYGIKKTASQAIDAANCRFPEFYATLRFNLILLQEVER